MGLFDRLCGLICKPQIKVIQSPYTPPPEKPQVACESIKLEYQEIQQIVETAFPLAKNLRILDYYVYTVERSEVERIIRDFTTIRAEEYTPEEHDCDDYAMQMNGFWSQESLSKYAFGIAMSQPHAYNFFIDKSKGVWIVEPQSLEIFSIDQARQLEIYNTIQYMV